jgi:hypothetical protein
VSVVSAAVAIVCIVVAIVAHATQSFDVADWAGTIAYFALVVSVLSSIVEARLRAGRRS